MIPRKHLIIVSVFYIPALALVSWIGLDTITRKILEILFFTF